jgi:nitrogen fixation-related uncharacterized protein
VLAAEVTAIHTYIAITVVVAAMIAVWAAFLIWGWRSGQLRDETAKYRVFADDLPPAAPVEDAGRERRR